jgi:DNA-binding transcriptional regulator YiaG
MLMSKTEKQQKFNPTDRKWLPGYFTHASTFCQGILALRANLEMSQEKFAGMFLIGIDKLKEMEAAGYVPSVMEMVHFYMIARDPEGFMEKIIDLAELKTTIKSIEKNSL